MPTATTHDVRVHVETQYQPDQSDPLSGLILFAYHVVISNESEYAIQLQRRHWVIFDSNGEIREVEGEGVVGQKPILLPGEQHSYISACNLRSEMGKMSGTYLFERIGDRKMFQVEIPEFHMVAPYRLN